MIARIYCGFILSGFFFTEEVSGKHICKIGDELCGANDCYNPQYFQCDRNNSDSQYHKLCGHGKNLCGNITDDRLPFAQISCYDPLLQECHHRTGSFLFTVCSKGESVCGRECYNPQKFQCFDDPSHPKVCRRNESKCGSHDQSVCYDPILEICLKNRFSPMETKLCAKGDDLCYNTCYNPHRYQCSQWIHPQFNFSMNKVCRLNQSVCGVDCFDPNFEDCVFQSATGYSKLCAIGGNLCAGVCYNPKNYKCFTFNQWNYKLCPYDSILCGDDSNAECYDPNLEDCYFNITGSVKLCAKGKELCDQICYDPQQYVCVRYNSNPRQHKLCGINESSCNTFSGIKCYDPTIESCLIISSTTESTSNVARILCLKSDSLCGANCYNSVTHVCLLQEDSIYPKNVLCLSGQLQCDGKCYYPQTHNCLE